MPLDPQVKKLMDQRAANGGNPVPMTTPGPAVYRAEDRIIAGQGSGIPIRVYTPLGNGPFPALVWFHGGGWIGGSVDSVDSQARHLCKGAECVVVSVDYRLAPQHKFPAPVEDCYTATAWTARNAALFNIDPNRIAVGGTSAGSNLAAGVALMARDRKEPRLVLQVLVYPVTDRNFTTKSYQENGGGEYGLSKQSMTEMWDKYLAKTEDAKNPYAAPLQAKSLAGLPPALVQTAEYDPLRDEGEAYAAALKKAGVPTTCTRYPGLTHGFFGQWSQVDKAMTAVNEAVGALKVAYSAKTPQPAGRR